MATQEELLSRRAALLERFESLQRRVTHGDKTVEYDLSMAKVALEMLDKEVMRAAPSGNVVRHVRVITRKDL